MHLRRENILCWMEIFWTLGIIALPCMYSHFNSNALQFTIHFGSHLNFCSPENTNSLFSAIAWLIIPMEVGVADPNVPEDEKGWFTFHSWNLFVAICAIPRLVLYAHTALILCIVSHSLFNLKQ